jgi:hypothetical protein
MFQKGFQPGDTTWLDLCDTSTHTGPRQGRPRSTAAVAGPVEIVKPSIRFRVSLFFVPPSHTSSVGCLGVSWCGCGVGWCVMEWSVLIGILDTSPVSQIPNRNLRFTTHPRHTTPPHTAGTAMPFKDCDLSEIESRVSRKGSTRRGSDGGITVNNQTKKV